MTYATSNPPKMMSYGGVTGVPSLWFYTSTDNATTVDVPGYFTNALALGIKAGDYLLVLDSDASPPVTTLHRAVSYSGSTLTITTGDVVNTGTSGS